ncbi:MAG TPA: hypothetical protein H9888_05055 [Candidatus Rikenella faecigallinarum]|uniref:Fibrobacter succinogenes major paralogous domain-containing protein n=1 Tax=Candidatus Rikenella faecigallinarum TaxID=2838745 RepID=A0A9D1QCJ0_9BACT|nr:hypothetical protein [Candidatus Rikenella faecigallinarum]
MTEDANGYKKVNITAIIGGEPNTAEYTVKNPLTFIYSTVTPWDWYATLATNQDNTLWGERSDKSAYDPCPKGWRIPQDGTWDDFLINNFQLYIQGVVNQDISEVYYQTNGRLYNELTWYSTSGQISKSGLIGGIGFGGYVHTLSITNTGAYCLRFVLNAVTPNNFNYRIYGISVRCVQE